MSPLPVILDAEQLVGGWLREHDDITALDARVGGRTPDTLTHPWVRVTQLAAPDEGHGLERLIDYIVQCDCYAGSRAMSDFQGQATASALAKAARAVLKALEGTTTDGAVVTRVRFSTHLRAPDAAMEPAMERVILTAELKMRPA